jgi:hypothetical protein
MKNLTTEAIEALKVSAELDIEDINRQLSAGQNHEVTNALLRTKNERISQLQDIKTELAQRAKTYPKEFTRSLNESFEL